MLRRRLLQILGSSATAPVAALARGRRVAASEGAGTAPDAQAPAATRLRWAQGWLLWRDFAGRSIPLTEAVADLRAVGADGIELTPRPGELAGQGLTLETTRALLDEAGLSVSAHYFSGPFHDRTREEEIVGRFGETLASLAALGGRQVVIGPPTVPEGADRPALIRAMAPVLEDLARRGQDEGVSLGLHPHLNTLVERPEEIALAMDVTDAGLVSLAPDTGHIHLAGGDVVSILNTYRSRLVYFHFKDAVRPFRRPDFMPNMRELGAGEIDFPGVMRLLAEIGYQGWINVEQDHTTLTPRESCRRSMHYVDATLKPIYR
ncbi:MAG: TIM barrel protein [Acidobacteriota bacterium]|jgi:inosose dehydratase